MAEMEAKQNQWKVTVVESSTPVTSSGRIFDIISGFLDKDKHRQLSMEFLEVRDRTFLRGSWNALRQVANSLIDEEYPQREPIPEWIDDCEASPEDVLGPAEIVASFDYAPSLRPVLQEEDSTMDDMEDVRRAMKKEENEKAEKKMAKKAKKEAKKAKKAEKKSRKEAKKRKREEE